MARDQRYVNPASPTASNANTGADWSANAWLSLAPLNNASSIDCWVEAGTTIDSTASCQINNPFQITVRQRTEGEKPVVTFVQDLIGVLTWQAITTVTASATTVSTIWKATPPDEPLFVAFNSMNAVIDAFGATSSWNRNAEHVKRRYIDVQGTIRPGDCPGRIGQFCTTGDPLLIVYAPTDPNTYYSHIYVGYGALIRCVSASAVEFHDLKFINCGTGIRWGGSNSTCSANLVSSCLFYNVGDGHHIAWNTTASGQGRVNTRKCQFQYTQRHAVHFQGYARNSEVSSCSFDVTCMHVCGAAVRVENTQQTSIQYISVYDNVFRRFQNNIYFVGEDGGAFYADSSTAYTLFYRNYCFDGKAAYRNNSGRPGHRAYFNCFSSCDIAFSISDSESIASASLTLANNTILSTYRAHGTADEGFAANPVDAALTINNFGKGTVNFYNNVTVNSSGALAFGIACISTASATAVCVENNNIFQGVQDVKVFTTAAGNRTQTVHASTTVADPGFEDAGGPVLSTITSKAATWGNRVIGISDQRDFHGRWPGGAGVAAGCLRFIVQATIARYGI